MKLTVFGKWLPLVAVCCLLGACQQLADMNLESAQEGVLKVKTRSVVSQEIVYPINLYAFSEDGKCTVSQIVEDEDESAQLSLPAGKYRVVAIGGYSDNYEIPSEPNLDDEIWLLGENGAETPLMMGKADVMVGADKESRLELTLSNSVASIDVALSNVPSEVTNVKAILSSFYSAMDMNGDYVDSEYSLELNCSLDKNKRWISDTRYVFPGNGSQVTLSIILLMEDGEELNYGYVWKDVPEANQPYHLQGEYSDAYSLNGTFFVQGWNEAKDVEFEFGAVSSSEEEKDNEEEDEPEVDLSGVPEVGTIWKGTIVADVVEADESGADLLLMSLDEWDATTSQVEDVVSGYSVGGFSDWRLPTYEEAKLLQNTFSGDNRLSLNELIAEYDETLWGIDGEERYLCDKSGTYYTFIFAGGRVISKAGTKKSYYVRLVKSYRMEF